MSVGVGIAGNGGGCKGLIALFQYDYLHKKLGNKFFRHFDFVAGTSTLGLVSGLQVVGKSPKEIIDIYVEDLPEIFQKRFFGQLRGLSKYDNEYLKGLATELIGNVRLGDLNQKLIIPTVNASLSKQKIFKSYDPKDQDYLLVDVLMATSAAPTFFPAYNIKGNWYKDGGLAENNPSEIVRKEIKAAKYDKTYILNITTGRQPERASKAEQKGNLLSVPPMIDEMLDVQDQVTKGHVEFAFKSGDSVGGYYRCESIIKHSSGKIDDVSKRNIEAMIEDGRLSVEANKKLLDLFILNTLRNE
jgi:patatin-like phospholipase/acyl hydrolase